MAADSNVGQMIQAVIDHPNLERYYHVDQRPDRKPLVIALTGASTEGLGDVKKFGVPVKFSASPGSGPVLSMTVREGQDGQTEIEFSYPPEGVAGRAVFADQGGRPVLRDIAVSER